MKLKIKCQSVNLYTSVKGRMSIGERVLKCKMHKWMKNNAIDIDMTNVITMIPLVITRMTTTIIMIIIIIAIIIYIIMIQMTMTKVMPMIMTITTLIINKMPIAMTMILKMTIPLTTMNIFYINNIWNICWKINYYRQSSMDYELTILQS